MADDRAGMTAIPQHIHALETFARGRGLRLCRMALPDCLHGRQGGDQIVLRSGLSPDEELRVLVHELTHWLVHRERALAFHRTIFEYEAEAVEALVMAQLGLPAAEPCAEELLSHSVRRVASARNQICAVLGLDDAVSSEPQSAVEIDAPAREELVLEDEEYRVRDLLRPSEST
ncbi:MAG: ImmA/IrrE family metallo-endopeptidase [Steroidobacteraceae bacterium]